MLEDGFRSLASHVATFLKQRGFRRRGTSFFQVQDGNWVLIELQRSQKTTADALVFTVNVGVVLGCLARFFSIQLKPNQPPQASEWHWRQRLGFLMPEGSDKWWTIGPGTEVVQLSREIEGALELALHDMRKYRQEEALRELWLTGQSPGLTDVQRLKNLAVLVRDLGPQDRLAPILDELRQVSSATAILLERKLLAGAGI